MFFVIIKGTVGKEVFLTDLEGFNNLHEAFNSGKDYTFLNYNPLNLEEASYVCKKNGTVFGFEIKSEK